MTKLVFLSFFTIIAITVPAPVPAQTLIETIDDWSALRHGTGNKKICFIQSVPTKETGNYKKRGHTLVLVAHRPAEKSIDVFELRAGYSYKKNSEVIVNIDGHKFKLFTFKNTAWAKTPKTDRALTRAMIRGRIMTAAGISIRGTKTLDTYSLKGFTAAYNVIGKICEVK